MVILKTNDAKTDGEIHRSYSANTDNMQTLLTDTYVCYEVTYIAIEQRYQSTHYIIV